MTREDKGRRSGLTGAPSERHLAGLWVPQSAHIWWWWISRSKFKSWIPIGFHTLIHKERCRKASWKISWKQIFYQNIGPKNLAKNFFLNSKNFSAKFLWSNIFSGFFQLIKSPIILHHPLQINAAAFHWHTTRSVFLSASNERQLELRSIGSWIVIKSQLSSFSLCLSAWVRLGKWLME